MWIPQKIRHISPTRLALPIVLAKRFTFLALARPAGIALPALIFAHITPSPFSKFPA
jgi:hypothetical protein